MFEKIKENWKSGLTVAFVSIPLSVSLAVASQATPVEGILTAIWAGLMASIFGGSNYNIVGPAGALTGILAAFALTYGASLLPMLAVVTGIFILISWVFKLERYLVFIPASVVHGFTLGVAITIAGGQLNSALGLSGLQVHERFVENMVETFLHLSAISMPTFLVFTVFLMMMFVMLKLLPKIPPAIVLVLPGILLGYLSTTGTLPIQLATLGSKFPALAPVLFKMPTLRFEPSLIVTGIAVALVAILETLLSAKIADGMTGTHYNKRKEMFGLGIANLVSGAMGGLPATGVLARTATNIKTGATHKVSATINCIAIAVVSFLFLGYFRYIPIAVIAAILMFVAFRMVERERFIEMWYLDKKSFWISILVTVIMVYIDPIYGILVGTVVSLLLLVEKMSRGQFELILNHSKKGIVHRVNGDTLGEIDVKGEIVVYAIKGQLLHLNAEAHLERFSKGLSEYKRVVIRLRELLFIDMEGVECISEIIDMAHQAKKEIVLTGVSPFVERWLEESEEYLGLKKKKLVFEKTADALRYFGQWV